MILAMVSFLVSMRTPCVPSRPRVFAHADFCISHSFPCPAPPTPALLRMTAQDAMSSREPLVPQPEKPPSLGPRHSVGTFPLALSTALIKINFVSSASPARRKDPQVRQLCLASVLGFGSRHGPPHGGRSGPWCPRERTEEAGRPPSSGPRSLS